MYQYQPRNFVYQSSNPGFRRNQVIEEEMEPSGPTPMTGVEETTPSRNTGSFTCDLCEVTCLNEEMYFQHMKGAKHQKKLKRKEIERLWSEKDPSVYCAICDLALEPALMENHLIGVKHRSVVKGKSLGDVTGKVKENPEARKPSATPANPNKVNNQSPNSSVSEIECELCSIKLKSLAAANKHFNSKSHGMKCVKKYFDEKKAAERNSENSFYCEVCDIALNGQATYESHLKGFKHNYKITNGNFDANSPFAAKSLRMKEKLEKMKELQRAKKMKLKLQRQDT